jgi:hypothetical protein
MVTVTLPGLVTTQNEAVSPAPTLTTDLLQISQQPSECSAIQSIVKSNPTANAYLDSIQLNTTITNLESFRDQIIASRADIYRTIPDSTEKTSIRTFYNRLNDGIVPQYRLINTCLGEAVEANVKVWKEQKEGTEESRDRYESLLHPERNVSYYEGWFPLFRPMTETALFVLFSIGAFLVLVSLALFLRMSGIQFQIQLPFGGDGGFDLEGYKPYIYTSVGFGIGIGIIGYARGWFIEKKD